jgi:hypothetical protein
MHVPQALVARITPFFLIFCLQIYLRKYFFSIENKFVNRKLEKKGVVRATSACGMYNKMC